MVILNTYFTYNKCKKQIMFTKIFLTVFFLGLNLYFFVHLYLKIKFKLIPAFFLLLLTAAVWIANSVYVFISNSDLLYISIFTAVQPITWHFYTFIFERAYSIGRNNKNNSSNNYVLIFNNVKRFVLLVLIPIIISINQLATIWQFDLK